MKGPKFTRGGGVRRLEATQGAGKGPEGAGGQQGSPQPRARRNRFSRRGERELAAFGTTGRRRRRQALAWAAGRGAISSPTQNFEGLSNQDNFNIFGFRVNPPDPVGDVGPNHYVEMINLVFAVYSKTGTLLLGPVDTGTLWAGFAVADCTEPSGDPIVVYDQSPTAGS